MIEDQKTAASLGGQRIRKLRPKPDDAVSGPAYKKKILAELEAAYGSHSRHLIVRYAMRVSRQVCFWRSNWMPYGKLDIASASHIQ